MTAALIVVGWFAWPLFAPSPAAAAVPVAAAGTPAEVLQRELLRNNVNRPGDPVLNKLYAELSARHFTGTLPALQVMWEPRLAEVGRLAAEAFTLQGMFGNVGRHAVILLNPGLQSDPAALRRALSHEMVHAHLFGTGMSSGDHGPEFQAVLRRLADEGAFEGVVADERERTRLRAWLDAESARLDRERAEMDHAAPAIERERQEIERAVAALNARVNDANAQGRGWPAEQEVQAVTAGRDAYNQRAIDANDRAQRYRADHEHFNREVARYNLMLAYPDGLDQQALVKPRGGE